MNDKIDIQTSKIRLRTALFLSLFLTILMWIVFFLDTSLHLNLYRYGILPHSITGLNGIITAPFIHANFSHITSNTLPFLTLLTAVLFFYPQKGLISFLFIYFFAGFFTWCFGRSGYHIGMSGVVYGLASLLFFGGLFSGSREKIAVSLVIIFLYSGMLLGLVPDLKRSISWENHLGGVLAGFILSIPVKSVRTKKLYSDFYGEYNYNFKSSQKFKIKIKIKMSNSSKNL